MRVINNKIERDNYIRYYKRIIDEESTSSVDIIRRKFEFLRDTVTDGLYNGLLNCGPVGFDKLKMWHNGRAWTIELETEVFNG